MADEADKSDIEQEFLLKNNIQNAKPPQEIGPKKCFKCGMDNDRAWEGFAVCYSCLETE